MPKRGIRSRMLRLVMALTLSGSAISVRGCDPAVRDTLLSGIQTTANALADALVQTFFTSLQNNLGDGGSGQTTI